MNSANGLRDRVVDRGGLPLVRSLNDLALANRQFRRTEARRVPRQLANRSAGAILRAMPDFPSINSRADCARALPDAELIAAYHACDEEPGDPWLDTLVAEIERRELDL